jgi:hypothetical protein
LTARGRRDYIPATDRGRRRIDTVRLARSLAAASGLEDRPAVAAAPEVSWRRPLAPTGRSQGGSPLKRSFAALLAALALLVTFIPASVSAAPGGSAFVRTISRGATLAPHGSPSAHSVGAFEDPEFVKEGGLDSADAGGHGGGGSGGAIGAPSAGSNGLAGSNPQLDLTFDGINHRDNRLAFGGNQFSLEPPDQGLCVGNGFVVEPVNDAIRVFGTNGAAITDTVALNDFYGYKPSINRTTGQFGPFVTDPSCIYDPATQRWFVVILTLDQDPVSGDFLGTNHLDIAVSTTSSPTGAWAIYRVPVQDDGTDGTPDHHCSAKPDGSGHGPCLGDYPHIGADTNGFYITTNEYSFNGPEFKAAQVYAFSKGALADNDASVLVSQIDTTGADDGNPGFTLWPAATPTGTGSSASHGSEFFLSTNAAEEANGNGHSSHIVAWTLTNTNSLDGSSPDVSLSNKSLTVLPYAAPPASTQKTGSTPLRDCLNNKACATVLNGEKDPFHEKEYALDSNDTRMQQVVYVNGRLWGAWDTALKISGHTVAGIEWASVDPATGGKLVGNDYVGLANENLIYPAIAMLANGHGVMAFTVVGGDFFPSAGYAVVDGSGAGSIHIASAGAGPADGFSGTKYFNAPDPARPRWGDYGAAVPVGNSVWIASEYIGQTCTLAQYESGSFGSCGGTRTALANWGTRISKVTP